MAKYLFYAGWNTWWPEPLQDEIWEENKGFTCVNIAPNNLLDLKLTKVYNAATFAGAKIFGIAPCGPLMYGLQLVFRWYKAGGAYAGDSQRIWDLNRGFSWEVPPSPVPEENTLISYVWLHVYPFDLNIDQMNNWTNKGFIWRIDTY